jgi:hypothetical protein
MHRRDPRWEMRADHDKQTESPERPTSSRRPYQRPAIRLLGSVRDLTLTGGSTPIFDGGIPGVKTPP